MTGVEKATAIIAKYKDNHFVFKVSDSSVEGGVEIALITKDGAGNFYDSLHETRINRKEVFAVCMNLINQYCEHWRDFFKSLEKEADVFEESNGYMETNSLHYADDGEIEKDFNTIRKKSPSS